MLLGVATAYAVSNLLSVVVGGLLGAALPTRALGVGGGLLFMAFAVWNLRSHAAVDAAADRPASHAHVVLSVAAAMFVAELGDKTMLATATLAAQDNPVLVWVGATVGISRSGAVGVLVGRASGARLPERAIRIGSSVLFAAFGVALLATNLRRGATGLSTTEVSSGTGARPLKQPDLELPALHRGAHVGHLFVRHPELVVGERGRSFEPPRELLDEEAAVLVLGAAEEMVEPPPVGDGSEVGEVTRLGSVEDGEHLVDGELLGSEGCTELGPLSGEKAEVAGEVDLRRRAAVGDNQAGEAISCAFDGDRQALDGQGLGQRRQ